MSRRVRVVALGCRAAGDDGVGAAVLVELRRRGVRGIELVDVVDAAHLVEILLEDVRVVVVDAVIGTPAGRVVEPTPDQLVDARQPIAVHGFGASAAISLARALSGPRSIDLQIIGVTIAPPTRDTFGLSEDVAASVVVAADRVLAVIDDALHQ